MSESELERTRADLFGRAKAILEEQDGYREKISTLSAQRREVIDELRASGLKPADIAKGLGITRARMSQLTSAGPPPERAFLGDGKLTILVGQKPKPVNTRGAVVALETDAARTRIQGLAAAHQLASSHEVVPPPGIVDLNRDNLIVLAGPRLFPMVGQMLGSDPNIRFETDADGRWTLRDLNTGEVYRASPRDDDGNHINAVGPQRNFGYLGRLPRPDGKGLFLCLGGIHAIGTEGIAAYLEQNLPQLYSEVKTRRFSMVVETEYVIKSEYHPNTLEVTSTKQASPIYKRS